jgi:UDP-N-acetylglucosamine 1-carboxyvinyltransferase
VDLIVQGGTRLQGTVEVNSSKNAILPILAASLLTGERVLINKVPDIKDVNIISQLINDLGVSLRHHNQSLLIEGESSKTTPANDLVRQIRASFLVMGPLLARKGLVRVSLPGGCAIGNRPIDLHLKGLKALGADITMSCGDVIARAKRLNANHIYLDYPSVGATENIIMAAAMARGITFIENAALEPEIVDLANFINQMGGKITGAGTNIIKVQGVSELHGCEYTPISDRIEAGTYMVAAAATGGEVLVTNVNPEHLKAISAKLEETGADVREEDRAVRVKHSDKTKPVYLKTLPYPGFPTDMQAQFMAYLSLACGSSIITESVFENRFMHVQELIRLGANIKIEGRTAIVKGVRHLTGATVKATDLRAGAALIIAGLMAEGDTTITDSEHIDRGYQDIIKKLNSIGAQIERN